MEKPYLKKMDRVVKKAKNRLKALFPTDADKKYFLGGDIQTKLGAITLLKHKKSDIAKAIEGSVENMKHFIEADFTDKDEAFQNFWEEVQESYIFQLIRRTNGLRSYKRLRQKLSEQATKKIAKKWIDKHIDDFATLVKSDVAVGPFLLKVMPPKSVLSLVFLLDNVKIICKKLFGEFTTLEDMRKRLSEAEIEEVAVPKNLIIRLKFSEEIMEYESDCFYCELKNDLHTFVNEIKELVAKPKSLKEMATDVVCSIPFPFLNKFSMKIEKLN